MQVALPAPRRPESLRICAILLGLTAASSVPTVHAQVRLVADINKTPYVGNPSSNPRSITTLGNATYFFAETVETGVLRTYLWVSNGTSATTKKVPGFGPAWPTLDRSLAVVGSRLVFSYIQTPGSCQLWVVENGVARPLHEFAVERGSEPQNLTLHQGNLYFTVVTGSGDAVLYRSDWTTQGLSLVVDSSWNQSAIFNLTSFGKQLFFFAKSWQGSALHVSDGTAAGTRELVVGSERLFGGGPKQDMRVLGNFLYFFASQSAHGAELWRSDGTVAGTTLVRDIHPGPQGSQPAQLTVSRNKLWFTANGDATSGVELWESDGSAAGTKLHDLVPGAFSSDPLELTSAGSALWFSATSTLFGRELWIADNVVAPRRVADLRLGFEGSNPRQFLSLGGGALFVADGDNGTQIYYSQGAASTTRVHAKVAPHFGRSADMAVQVPWLLYRSAQGPLGSELYRTALNGATALVLDLAQYGAQDTQSAYHSPMNRVGARAIFAASDGVNGDQIWASDGTSAGTQRVSSITSDWKPQNQSLEFHETANGIVFVGRSAKEGLELWHLQGSTAALLKDLVPGAGSGNPRNFMQVGDLVYFIAEGQNAKTGLYVTDGTRAGTKRLTDVRPEKNKVVRMHDAFYWVGLDMGYPSLMRSDGTSSGTREIAKLDMKPSIAGERMCAVGSRLFLAAYTPTTGNELWVSDGQTATLVDDIVPRFGSSNPENLTAVGDLLFCTLNDGKELYRSDGSAAGSFRVFAQASSYIHSVCSFGEECWFTLRDGQSAELWKSDGTIAGTRRITKFAGVWALLRARVGDSMLIVVTDFTPERRNRLWLVDRKTEQARMLLDANNAPVEVYAFNSTTIQGGILFDASAGPLGVEPHVYMPGAHVEPVGSSCAGVGRNPRMDAHAPRIGQQWAIEGRGFQAGQALVTFLGAPLSRPIGLPGGCSLHVDPGTYLPIGFASRRSWTMSFSLPSDPKLLGLSLAVQALQVANDRALGFDLSSAMLVTLGS